MEKAASTCTGGRGCGDVARLVCLHKCYCGTSAANRAHLANCEGSRTQRKPSQVAPCISSSALHRTVVRTSAFVLRKDPPFIVCFGELALGQWLCVISHTLPAISCAPYGLFPCGKRPTSTGARRPAYRPLKFAGASWLPQGQVRPSVPRAAFSHSNSVGSLFPAQLQNASASGQPTPTTG